MKTVRCLNRLTISPPRSDRARITARKYTMAWFMVDLGIRETDAVEAPEGPAWSRQVAGARYVRLSGQPSPPAQARTDTP